MGVVFTNGVKKESKLVVGLTFLVTRHDFDGITPAQGREGRCLDSMKRISFFPIQGQ